MLPLNIWIKYWGGEFAPPLSLPSRLVSRRTTWRTSGSIISYLSQPQSFEDALIEEADALDFASPSAARPPSSTASGLRSGRHFHVPVVPFSLAFSPCSSVPPSPFVPPADISERPMAVPMIAVGAADGGSIHLPTWCGHSHVVDFRDRLLDFATGLSADWGGGE